MQSATLREIAVRFGYLRRAVLLELSRRLAPLDTTPPMYHLLFRLANDGELPQQDLGLDAGLDAAGVSRLITKMTKEGLLTTKVDPGDRRRRLVKITAKGRRRETALAPVVDEAVRAAVGAGLTEPEERQLLELLDKAVRSSMESGADVPRRD